MDLKVFVGSRIEAARKAAGLSLEGLAYKTGVGYFGVRKWENGKSLPSAENLVELAKALEKPVEWFFTGFGQATGTEGPAPAPGPGTSAERIAKKRRSSSASGDSELTLCYNRRPFSLKRAAGF